MIALLLLTSVIDKGQWADFLSDSSALFALNFVDSSKQFLKLESFYCSKFVFGFELI